MFILRDLLSLLQLQFSETKQGRRRSYLVLLYPAGDHCTLHLIDHLQLAAQPQYTVWILNTDAALLYLYGEFDSPLGEAMVHTLGDDPLSVG